MIIKGEYHDVLHQNDNIVSDSGWRSNKIVQDCGKFLAALMKKHFGEAVGVEYMAVGSGSTDPELFKTDPEQFKAYLEQFKGKVKSFFLNGSPPPFGDDWVWAKQILVEDIKFLTPEGNETTSPTNRIKIDVTFEETEPSLQTLVFKEFALVGVDGSLEPDKLFMINYVAHGPITKDKSMKLTRTVRLTFPIDNV